MINTTEKDLKIIIEIVLRRYYERKDGYIMSNAPSFGNIADMTIELTSFYNKDRFKDIDLEVVLLNIRDLLKFDDKESKNRDEFGNYK